MSSKVKFLITVGLVVLVVELVVLGWMCGFICIKPHINIAKGNVGEQEVTAIQFFDNLWVIDDNGNRKYWQNVDNYLFVEDDLIIETVNPKDENIISITTTVGRSEMNLKKLSGQPMRVVYDFSELTLVFDDGREMPYYNVKSVGFDKNQKILHILYFNGHIMNMHLETTE